MVSCAVLCHGELCRIVVSHVKSCQGNLNMVTHVKLCQDVVTGAASCDGESCSSELW